MEYMSHSGPLANLLMVTHITNSKMEKTKYVALYLKIQKMKHWLNYFSVQIQVEHQLMLDHRKYSYNIWI